VHFGLRKAAGESNFMCIFTEKNTLQFDKLTA